MSANIIIFDSQYIADQIRNIDKAKTLAEEAIGIIKKANQHRNWKCSETAQIENALNNMLNKLGRLNTGIMETANALSRGLRGFTELEQRAVKQANSMANTLKNNYGFEASTYGQEDKENLPVTLIPVVNLIKPILSGLDKVEKSDKARLANSGLSYLEALYNFYTGNKHGLTGAEDLCNLGDKSIGLWTGLYNYFQGRNDSENIFSMLNQKRVKGLDIIGSSFGLISSAFGIADKIQSGELGRAGVIGEVIGAGDNIVDIWGSIEKFRHVGEENTSFVKGEGLYSPLTFWSATAKSAVTTFSQGFKSYEKYAADGSWDLADTARTGIESGIAGLYSIADTLTFGGVSALGKVTGFTPENISADIENWSNDLGKQAGNYIRNNSSLLEAYSNSGPIGKTAITFHAAVQSGIQSVTEDIGNWFKSLFH